VLGFTPTLGQSGVATKKDGNLMDNGLEFFVQHERPNQVMNLILEE